jgi:hypothetical protein
MVFNPAHRGKKDLELPASVRRVDLLFLKKWHEN